MKLGEEQPNPANQAAAAEDSVKSKIKHHCEMEPSHKAVTKTAPTPPPPGRNVKADMGFQTLSKKHKETGNIKEP